MDYQLFRNILSPYLVDNMAGIQDVKKHVASISVDDAFDKKFLTVLNNIVSCLETCEAIKNLAANIFEEADFFSDTSIHKTTKSKYLDKILSDSDYIEQTKSFNLSVIQTYVEKIIHKQLYEINIKIEENQRSLNKMEAASGKMMREELQQANQHIQQLQQANQAQIAQQNRSLNKNLQSDQIVQIVKTKQPILYSSVSQTQAASQQGQPQMPSDQQKLPVQQPQNISSVSQNPEASVKSSFLLVEIDQQQCAITYSNILEILKFDKPAPEKVLRISAIPYNKLVGFARGSSVLRKVSDIQIDKKTLLNNMNVTLPNKEDKRFAVIINKDDDYRILFVDYIVYTEPVDGQSLGSYAKTVEGEYKIIN